MRQHRASTNHLFLKISHFLFSLKDHLRAKKFHALENNHFMETSLPVPPQRFKMPHSIFALVRDNLEIKTYHQASGVLSPHACR